MRLAMKASSIPLVRVFARNSALIKMAVPVFLEMILSVAMGYVNQFLLSPVPLASNAVAQANQISNMFIVSFSVLSTSSLILLTQLLGKNDTATAKKIYSLSIYLNLVIGIVVAGILSGLAFVVFPLMGVAENVVPLAKLYLLITAPSLVLQALTNVLGSFLRAHKRLTSPTVVAFLTNIINAVVASIFIFGFPDQTIEFKLIGVGIATCASRLVGLAASYIFFKMSINGSLSVKNLKPFPHKLLGRLMGIGLPTAGETLSYQASQLVLAIIINYAVGVLDQNLRTYIITFTSIIYLFAQGTGVAMQVTEGTLLGEGKKDEAARLVQDVGTMARTVSFIMALLITALAYPIFTALMYQAYADPSVNVDNTSLHTIGTMAIFCMLIDVVLDQGRATNLVYVKGLETAGDINFPVSCSIVTSWVFTVGVSALLCIVCGLGIYGAFIGAALDECVRAVLFYIRWKKGGWRNKAITKGLGNEEAN